MQERRQTILDLIHIKYEVRLSELKELFPSVSEMTLRRDLDYLAKEKKVVRTHGGARSISTITNIEKSFEFTSRAISNTNAKKVLSEYALSLLEPHRSIFLDSGSTMLTFSQMIPDIELFVITNAPNIGLEIAKRKNTEIIFLGGSLNKLAIALTGPFAINCLDQVNIDIAFIAASGFSPENGFTNAYINECELKRKVIKIAKKVIVLMDSSKVYRSLPFTFATLDDVDVLVTDRPLPEEIEVLMRNNNIEVLS